MPKLPKLPQLLDRKIYKTGQTRGADDDDIFQNRVGRNSTVLIPRRFWTQPMVFPEGETGFDSGYIVLIEPEYYFGTPDVERDLASQGLRLGNNVLVFYETRQAWVAHPPAQIGWVPAESRVFPLGGQYVARVSATTATTPGQEGLRVVEGFRTTDCKGAGIRLYEYASTSTTGKCRNQLEALYWLCHDSVEIALQYGMSRDDAATRKTSILTYCAANGLLDLDKLREVRAVDQGGETVCPLCLENVSGASFFDKMVQAEGRGVPDLTVTQITLFHLKELRYGKYGHQPYNVGWGHYHCNTVTKDSGIAETLQWMRDVLARNDRLTSGEDTSG